MYDWIDVKEQLPSNIEEVLLTWDGENISAFTYYDRFREKWMQMDEYDMDIEYSVKIPITHWFMFPQPPPIKKKIMKVDFNQKRYGFNRPPNCS